MPGGSQKLQRAILAIWADHVGIGADINVRGLQLDDRTSVDHYGHTLRDVESSAIDLCNTGIIHTNQVGPRVRFSRDVAVGAAVSRDAHQVGRIQQTVGPFDIQRDEIRQIHTIARSRRRGEQRDRTADVDGRVDRIADLRGDDRRRVGRGDTDGDVRAVDSATNVCAVELKNAHGIRAVGDREDIAVKDTGGTAGRCNDACGRAVQSARDRAIGRGQ